MTFTRQWFLWNAGAWSVGFILFSPIAHGITGGHGPDLSVAEYAAHSMGLVVAAVIVAIAQRRVLSRFIPVSWNRVIAAPILFNIGFWGGGELPYFGPDMDFIIGSMALSLAVWPGNVSVKGHFWAGVLAVLSFAAANFVAQLLVVIPVIIFNFTPDLQASELQHFLYTSIMGIGAGVLGGWWSGLALTRMIPSRTIDAKV